MRRTLTTLALTAAMILGGASVALAHPPDGNPGLAKGFNSEPVLKSGLGHANENGITNGIVPGFVVHSPACAGHPGFH